MAGVASPYGLRLSEALASMIADLAPGYDVLELLHELTSISVTALGNVDAAAFVLRDVQITHESPRPVLNAPNSSPSSRPERYGRRCVFPSPPE
jgi:hypothetical protein